MKIISSRRLVSWLAKKNSICISAVVTLKHFLLRNSHSQKMYPLDVLREGAHYPGHGYSFARILEPISPLQLFPERTKRAFTANVSYMYILTRNDWSLDPDGSVNWSVASVDQTAGGSALIYLSILYTSKYLKPVNLRASSRHCGQQK